MDIATVEKLQEFGLSEKEAKVYFVSLGLGSATAEQISKQASVNRSTTYVQIERLMEMGLMSTHEEGKKTMFSPEAPTNLSRLLKKQIDSLELQATALEQFVPQLSRIFDSAGERPMVRFFEGKEGLTSLRNEVLKIKNTTVYFILSFDYLWDIYDWNELIEFTTTKAERNITSKVLYNKTGEDIPSSEEYKLDGRRLPTEGFPFESDIYIYDNKVAIASTKGKIAGVIIESESIAKSMLSLFMLAWDGAAPKDTKDPGQVPAATKTKKKK